MFTTNGLYGLVGVFGNHITSVVILCTIILAGLVVYFRLKKLLLFMIVAFLSASVFFFKYSPSIVFTKDDLSVFSDGSFLYLYEIHNQKLEYTKYSKRNKLIEMGTYENKKFHPYKYFQKSNYNFFADFIILSIMLIILYLVLFFKDDYIRYRDFKRNISLIPFSYKTKEQKISILKQKAYCKACNSKEIMSLEKEIYSKGMHMLYFKCYECFETTKERVSLGS